MKRSIISVLLVLCMLIGLLPGTALASSGGASGGGDEAVSSPTTPLQAEWFTF